jgi:hypothetical protein
MALSEYEDAIDSTLIPPRAQYGVTRGNAKKGNWLRYAGFATSCTPLQPLTDHS